jgi:hypothetical protein
MLEYGTAESDQGVALDWGVCGWCLPASQGASDPILESFPRLA